MCAVWVFALARHLTPWLLWVSHDSRCFVYVPPWFILPLSTKFYYFILFYLFQLLEMSAALCAPVVPRRNKLDLCSLIYIRSQYSKRKRRHVLQVI